MRYKDLDDRWDALEQSLGIVGQLNTAKYPVTSIGKSFEIIKMQETRPLRCKKQD